MRFLLEKGFIHTGREVELSLARNFESRWFDIFLGREN